MKKFTDFLAERSDEPMNEHAAAIVGNVDIAKSIEKGRSYINAVKGTSFHRDQEDSDQARDLIDMLSKASTAQDLDKIRAKQTEYKFDFLVPAVVDGVDIAKSIEKGRSYAKAVRGTGFYRDQEDAEQARELIDMLSKARTAQDIDKIRTKQTEYRFNLLVPAGK